LIDYGNHGKDKITVQIMWVSNIEECFGGQTGLFDNGSDSAFRHVSWVVGDCDADSRLGAHPNLVTALGRTIKHEA